MTIFTL